MKIKRIEYKHVKPIEGFNDVESTYRELRDKLDTIIQSLTWLQTYEHGGSKMKNIFSKLKVISTTSRIGVFDDNNDIYESNANMASEIARISHKQELHDLCEKYSSTYQEISNLKASMNNKIKIQIGKVQGLKDMTADIDKKRKKLQFIRYDLELSKQNSKDKTPEDLSKMQDLDDAFKKNSIEIMNDMKRFVGSEGIAGILASTAAAHLEFVENEAKALSKIK